MALVKTQILLRSADNEYIRFCPVCNFVACTEAFMGRTEAQYNELRALYLLLEE